MRRISILLFTFVTFLVSAAWPQSDAPKKQQIITFDAPGAGTLAAPCLLQGTFPYRINDKGEIGGNFQDANNVLHGFMRARNGRFEMSARGSADIRSKREARGFRKRRETRPSKDKRNRMG